MATVTSFTAARSAAIETTALQSIVSASVIGDNLILTRANGATVNAGNVRGPAGTGGGGAGGFTQAEIEEFARDALANALIAGANVTITPNDIGNLISISATGGTGGSGLALEEAFPVTFARVLSSPTSVPPAASTTTPVAYLRAPYAFKITEVRAFQLTPDGSTITIVDVHMGASPGTSILAANRLQIDAAERTSETAAAGGSLSATTIDVPDDGELWFYIDQRGDASREIVVWLLGVRNLTTSTTPTFPGQPGVLTITNNGSGSLLLNWSAPTFVSGQPAVTSYRVESSLDGVTWNTTLYGATSDTLNTNLSRAITSLTNGQTYHYRIRAINTIGAGNPTAGVSRLVAIAPTAPTITAVSASTATSALVTYSAPISDGGAAIADYTVEYSTNGGTTWTAFADGANSTALTRTVTGLTTGNTYIFRAAAANSAGLGAYSANSGSITLTAGGLSEGVYLINPTGTPVTLVSTATSYADSRAGTGTATLTADNTIIRPQQNLNGSNYICRETFVEFATSIAGGSEVKDAWFELVRDASDYTVPSPSQLQNVRGGYIDFGAQPATTADWIASGGVGARWVYNMPLAGSAVSPGAVIPSVNNVLYGRSINASTSNQRAAINNASGITRIALTDGATAIGTPTPTDNSGMPTINSIRLRMIVGPTGANLATKVAPGLVQNWTLSLGASLGGGLIKLAAAVTLTPFDGQTHNSAYGTTSTEIPQITGWNLRYKTLTATAWTTVAITLDSTLYGEAGSIADTGGNYVAQLQAVNSVGAGPWSNLQSMTF